jgi:hypothetical protein
MPEPPEDAPPGMIWFGGPIPWFSISLSIRAPDLDPDEISGLLGVWPDVAWRKGVRYRARTGTRGRLPSFGNWSICLRCEQTDEWDLEAAIDSVLDRIAVSDDVWRLIVSKAKARLFIGLTLDTRNRGFGLSSALLRRIADYEIQLDFDIYSELPRD